MNFNRLTKQLALTGVLLLTATAGLQAQEVRGIIGKVRGQYAPDKRVAVFEVKGEKVNDTHYILKGKCDNPEALAALEQELKRQDIPYTSYVQLLPSAKVAEKPWALVTLSSVNIRTEPSHAAEFGTQGLMGTPVKVLDKEGGWYRVQTPDNYIAWVDAAAIARKTDREMQDWREARRYIYTDYLGHVYASPDEKNPAVVSDIVLGCIVQPVAEGKGKSRNNKRYLEVALPDGRTGFVKRSEVTDLAEWSHRPLVPENVEKTARTMMGVPYLWGGTSVKGVDCSGFVKTSYFANGVIIARDASQQALIGERLDPKDWPAFELGDLIFFGNPKTGRVTHVGMYLRGGQYIHSSGRVKVNSVDPDADDYLTTPFLSGARIKNKLNTPGIVPVKDHPWYFSQAGKQR